MLNITGKGKGNLCPWDSHQTVHSEDSKNLLWMCNKGDLIGFTKETGINFNPFGGKGKGSRCPMCGGETLQFAKKITGGSKVFVSTNCEFVAIKLEE